MINNSFADQRDFVSVSSNPKIVLVIDKIHEKVLAGKTDSLNHFASNQTPRGNHCIHKTDRLPSALPWHSDKSISPKKPEVLKTGPPVHGQASQNANVPRLLAETGQASEQFFQRG